MSATAKFVVSGMTCGHCVASVKEKISALPGVEVVSVDLVSGEPSEVVVTSAGELDRASVENAVTEAGYQLV